MSAKMAWVIVCAAISCWPVVGGHVRFFGITTPLSIEAPKNQPPFIAFDETAKEPVGDEWDQIAELPSRSLLAGRSEPAVETSSPPPTLSSSEPIRLEPLRVERPTRVETEKPERHEWISQLPPRQRERLIEAQKRYGVLSQASAPPSAPTSSPGTTPPLSVTAAPKPELPDEFDISGAFEIAGGLPFLGSKFNHHFEVVRQAEGVVVDQGRMNVRDAMYSIRVRGRQGRVVARLIDESGRVLGEDSFYLSQLRSSGGAITGPKLVLRQRRDIAGYGRSFYPGRTISKFSATAFSGAAPAQASRDGEFELNEIQKGSMTVLRAEAADHLRSVALVPAGYRGDLMMFPKAWVESLKQVVSEQRRMNLNSPDSPVIWGKVVQDGRPRAGVAVRIESEPGAEAIYFNQLLLPDPDLKATSENGLFAFIGASEGFHSLAATVGDGYLSHRNVVVEAGAVSIAELDATMRTEPAPVRVFDAFTGAPRPAAVIHQAVFHEISVDEPGSALVSLPILQRMSIVHTKPEAPYAAASYLMSDDDGFVHLPLIREDWLRSLQGWARIPDVPDTSVVVGFVPDDNFTVEVVDPEEYARVVYFSAAGEPAEKGIARGGFAIFGLSRGVREVVVKGERTGLLATRVIPSDPRALVVLTYRAE